MTAQLEYPDLQDSEALLSIRASIAEGLRFVRGEEALKASFAIDLVAMSFGMPRALFAVLAISVYHAGAEGTGLLYAAVAGLVVTPGVFPPGRGVFVRVAGTRALRHLGHVSYGVFCIHLLVLRTHVGGGVVEAGAQIREALSRFGRLKYRLYRHPAVMFGIGPAYMFILQHRLPVGLMRGGLVPWLSTQGTNAAIAAALAGSRLWPHFPVHLSDI